MNERLVKATTELVESVSFDMNGTKVGNVYQGGNGGLISIKTLKAADECRRALDAINATNT